MLKRRDFLILLGNSIDHFDTAIYSFIAPILSLAFFPNEEPVVGLILIYTILTTSVITRPIGSIIFGIIAKRLGPHLALSYSLFGVAVTTISIGFIPNYEMVGSASVVMLTIVRMIQGIFAEGECTISKLCILEDKPQSDAFKASYLYQLSTMAGIIVASFASSIIIAHSSHEWWRLAFILGGSCGAIGFYLRSSAVKLYSKDPSNWSVKQRVSERSVDKLREHANPPTFYETNLEEQKSMHIGIEPQGGFGKTMHILWSNKLNLLRISIITGFSYMTYVVPFVVMNNFVPDITSISFQTMMNCNTLLLILDAIMIPIIGYLLRGHKPKHIMIIGCLVLFISIVPLWFFMENGTINYINIVRLWVIILGVIFLCPLNLLLGSILNNRDKYMVIGIGDAIGTSVFGRFTPAICIALWHFTSAPLSIAFYIAFISLVTIWALNSLKVH